MKNHLSTHHAIVLLAIVVFAWGINWPITKATLHYLSPLWITALRSGLGMLALLAICLTSQRLVLPRRGDVPVVLSVGLLHMVAFSVLVTIGLQFVPAGRSVVLAYTTPLWVVPGARLFLGESLTPQRLIGVGLGLTGLLWLFNPLTFDWSNHQIVVGNLLILMAAFCWAASILYVRSHTWVTAPFELVFWQALLATVVLTLLAFQFEGVPKIGWTLELVLLLLYGGLFGIALAYWAINTVNRALPAVTTSLGLLGVPVLGILCSALALHESVDMALLSAMSLIIGGIAVGTAPFAKLKFR